MNCRSLPPGQQAFRDAHRSSGRGLKTGEGVRVEQRHQVFLPHHLVGFHRLGNPYRDRQSPFTVAVVCDLHIHAHGVADVADGLEGHVQLFGREGLAVRSLGQPDRGAALHRSDPVVQQLLCGLSGAVQGHVCRVYRDPGPDRSAQHLVHGQPRRLALYVPKGDVQAGYRPHLGAPVPGVIGQAEHGLPVPFDCERVAADKQWAKPVVHGDFDHRRRVECLAQSDDTLVGVHLHPDDHGVLSHPDSLYLRNLHGRAPIQASGSRAVRR